MQKEEKSAGWLGLPDKTKKKLLEIDPNIQVVKTIRNKPARLVLLVRSKGKEYFVKATKEKSWWHSDQYFRFKKEIFIYSNLEYLRFRNFHYPKLIHTDNKSFIFVESISNKYNNPQDPSYYKTMMNGIFEFNSCEFPWRKKGAIGWLAVRYNSFKVSESVKIPRNLFRIFFSRRIISLSVFVKTMGFFIKAFAGTVKLKRPLLLHRDLRFGVNRLYPTKDKVYFIDFEKAAIEKRWVFNDALVLAEATPLFYPDDNVLPGGFPRFYRNLIEDYWEKLLAKDFRTRQKDYFIQLKFCLLSWSLRKIAKEKNTVDQQKKITKFIETVILGTEDNFNKWYKNLPCQSS